MGRLGLRAASASDATRCCRPGTLPTARAERPERWREAGLHGSGAWRDRRPMMSGAGTRGPRETRRPARPEAGAGQCRAACRHSPRCRPPAVDRRGPPQALGLTKGNRRHPGQPDPRAVCGSWARTASSPRIAVRQGTGRRGQERLRLGRRRRRARRAVAPQPRPPGNKGVAERLDRTLKEQIVFGRIHQGIEHVRAAARKYFARDNQHWLLAKNDCRSPAEPRRRWMAAAVASFEAA